MNRRGEFALHDVEMLSALALALHGAPYPSEELTRLWKLVLFNQFHDILPGSSIREVYDDSDREYADVLESTATLTTTALERLAGPASGSRVCAVNTLSFPRTEVVELPAGVAGGQVAAGGQALGVVSAPMVGYSIGEPLSGERRVMGSESVESFVLQNDFVRATFLRDGHLAGLYDLGQGRECVAPGARANHFVLFDDYPNTYDAWDVDIFHFEKPIKLEGAVRAKLIETGPLRASVEFEVQLSPSSTLKQTVSLTALSARLEFATEVEWRESHKFLKVEFPLNLRSQKATYEIQFGHLERPTHFNTSWDVARFETYAHKWADLSEPDYGVALLNDCKYGCSVHGSVMRLSLLRAPKSPDPQADMGRHAFRYALLPHAGSFQEAGVVAEAYRFNSPLLVRACDQPAAAASFFSVSRPTRPGDGPPGAVVIDTVKKAEDSDNLILRLYEAHGTRGTVRLSSSLPVKSAVRCNLLEDEAEALEWSDGGVSLDMTPFQIVTLKLSL
jgi:alpha-mannosidase